MGWCQTVSFCQRRAKSSEEPLTLPGICAGAPVIDEEKGLDRHVSMVCAFPQRHALRNAQLATTRANGSGRMKGFCYFRVCYKPGIVLELIWSPVSQSLFTATATSDEV